MDDGSPRDVGASQGMGDVPRVAVRGERLVSGAKNTGHSDADSRNVDKVVSLICDLLNSSDANWAGLVCVGRADQRNAGLRTGIAIGVVLGTMVHIDAATLITAVVLVQVGLLCVGELGQGGMRSSTVRRVRPVLRTGTGSSAAARSSNRGLDFLLALATDFVGVREECLEYIVVRRRLRGGRDGNVTDLGQCMGCNVTTKCSGIEVKVCVDKKSVAALEGLDKGFEAHVVGLVESGRSRH